MFPIAYAGGSTHRAACDILSGETARIVGTRQVLPCDADRVRPALLTPTSIRSGCDELQIAIELKPVTIGVLNMELPCSPTGVEHRSRIKRRHNGGKLCPQAIDIPYEKAISRTINGMVPLGRVMPLEVEFHRVPTNASVFRIFDGV